MDYGNLKVKESIHLEAIDRSTASVTSTQKTPITSQFFGRFTLTVLRMLFQLFPVKMLAFFYFSDQGSGILTKIDASFVDWRAPSPVWSVFSSMSAYYIWPLFVLFLLSANVGPFVLLIWKVTSTSDDGYVCGLTCLSDQV